MNNVQTKRPAWEPEVDGHSGASKLSAVTYTEAYQFYCAALRRDPATPAPALGANGYDAVRTWKVEMRAYDQAKLDLGLVTPEAMQQTNTATEETGLRIVRHTRYV
jgi:hypothetical protein